MQELEALWTKLCSAMPASFIDHPFGPETTVFKVAGRDKNKAKVFALIIEHAGELLLNLKADPALADVQRAQYPQITPGYHMNKKHWNSIHAGLDEQFVLELIEDSYDLVVESMPRKDQEAIRWRGIVAQGEA